MDEIQGAMLKIIEKKNPSVFDVSIMKKDHSMLWIAYATLRGDGRHFSVEHEDPALALEQLNLVLDSLICPHCHQIIQEERK